MKDTIENLIGKKIEELGLVVDDAYISDISNMKSLNIILDSEEVIDLDKITLASEIINPIIDQADLLDCEYVLDISSKEKGVDNNEW